MKSILYIGNNLNNNKTNVSAIGALGPLLEDEGYQLYYASSHNNKIKRIFDMIYTCYKCRNKVDYVLIDTYSTWNFYYAFTVSQLCRFLKVKYIPILHGGNLPKRLKSSRLMSKLIFKNAYQNISPSLYLKEKFSELGYSNVNYIPNTLEIEKYPFANKNIQVPKLLWVRSFSEIYNPQLAIEVLRLLQKTHKSSELCMVGPDSDGSFDKVKKLANSYNLKVKFTGKLKKTQWIELSKDYNIFINTTNYDNTPLSVIEAMALGLPVVSTNAGGLPYLIDDSVDGVLVGRNSASAMVKAIEKLYDDSKLRMKIIDNARQKAEKFGWSRVKKNWSDILN